MRSVLAVLLAILGWTLPASGQGLAVPPERRQAVIQALDDACPECRRTGFVACGAAAGPGRTGPGPMLQGTPRRGYLVGFVMTGDEFRKVVRGTTMTPLVAGLERRFQRARLVVLEDGFARTRVLDQNPRVSVEMPAELHSCVANNPDKPWGCSGAGRGDGGSECCEKTLGSPSVALTWIDPAGEEIRFEFRHRAGEARLLRQSGGRRTTYSCATDRRYGLD